MEPWMIWDKERRQRREREVEEERRLPVYAPVVEDEAPVVEDDEYEIEMMT